MIVFLGGGGTQFYTNVMTVRNFHSFLHFQSQTFTSNVEANRANQNHAYFQGLLNKSILDPSDMQPRDELENHLWPAQLSAEEYL